MNDREILVADSDNKAREQLAESFREAGYRVETTDSTVHVFCTVLEKQIPVVLLGSGCDRKIALPELVPLLKKCNRRVTIILVSDEESLPTAHALKQEGIFYHALRPSSRDDTDEILTAVQCAFNRPVPERTTYCPATPDCRMEVKESPVPGQCLSGEPDITHDAHTTEARHGEERKMRAKTTAIVATLTAAIAGMMYYTFTTPSSGVDNGEFLVWSFLGFCALIIVGQLLPLVFSLREAQKAAQSQEAFGAARAEEARAVIKDK